MTLQLKKMNKITNIIANKMINKIDNFINDSINDGIDEYINTHLKSNVFTRFDDSMNHSFTVWSQVINEINYAKHKKYIVK